MILPARVTKVIHHAACRADHYFVRFGDSHGDLEQELALHFLRHSHQHNAQLASAATFAARVCRNRIISMRAREVDRPANVNAALAVEQVFKKIAAMMIIDPLRASFAPDAQELFNAWRAELEHRIRRATLPPALEAHLSKYRKLMPAIALILHLAESGKVPEVPLIQAQRAAGWCEFLESHARRVYSGVTSLPNRLAAELGEKLKQGVLGDRFRLRDVYLRGWAGLDTPEAVRMALTVLEDAGWVRRIDPRSGPQGGRPREEFALNPAVRRG
jgi:hypothetical protein